MEIPALGETMELEEHYIDAPEHVIRRQVDEYLEGDRQEFDILVEFPGSFTGRVMKQLAKIPYGETVTYGEIAGKLDSSAIAVGQACGRNPVPIILPCHRVVSSSGIGGFQYPGLKQKLLDLESRKTRESSR